MQDRSQLMTSIRLGFHHVTMKGNGPTLREADVLRQYGINASHRAAAARALDNDKRWWQISDASFDKAINPFVHFDNLGFVYHLPAIMTWSLKHEDRAKTHALLKHLINALILPTRWDLIDAQKKRFECVNREQAGIVANFLRYWQEIGVEAIDCEKALTAYWSKF